MDNVYIKQNPDWNFSNKSKYGYVKGNDINLVKRLNDSKEEHSEYSSFTNVFSFEKTDNYNLPYKEIDKIFSLAAPFEYKIKRLSKQFYLSIYSSQKGIAFCSDSRSAKLQDCLCFGIGVDFQVVNRIEEKFRVS